MQPYLEHNENTWRHLSDHPSIMDDYQQHMKKWLGLVKSTQRGAVPETNNLNVEKSGSFQASLGPPLHQSTFSTFDQTQYTLICSV